jgi:hypothetical protein
VKSKRKKGMNRKQKEKEEKYLSFFLGGRKLSFLILIREPCTGGARAQFFFFVFLLFFSHFCFLFVFSLNK